MKYLTYQPVSLTAAEGFYTGITEVERLEEVGKPFWRA